MSNGERRPNQWVRGLPEWSYSCSIMAPAEALQASCGGQFPGVAVAFDRNAHPDVWGDAAGLTPRGGRDVSPPVAHAKTRKMAPGTQITSGRKRSPKRGAPQAKRRVIKKPKHHLPARWRLRVADRMPMASSTKEAKRGVVALDQGYRAVKERGVPRGEERFMQRSHCWNRSL